MDGNGRWANSRSHRRIWGHVRGASKIKPIVKECDRLGVDALTLYAFSSENWARPSDEVNALMGLLKKYLRQEVPHLKKDNVRFRVIGDRIRWRPDVLEAVENAEQTLAENTGFQLTFAFGYGSRMELVFAMRDIAHLVSDQKINPNEVDEALIAEHLMTAGLPELDLLIRTGGETRISNFLLWQAAYSELYFSEISWPDFTTKHLHGAIEAFSSRQRRFGKTGDQVQVTSPHHREEQPRV